MKVLCFGSMNVDYVYRVDHVVRLGETVIVGLVSSVTFTPLLYQVPLLSVTAQRY